jgi:hypothetical protein
MTCASAQEFHLCATQILGRGRGVDNSELNAAIQPHTIEMVTGKPNMRSQERSAR